MTLFSRINPARRVVGRLFLWFWITFIFTAVTTFYAVNFFTGNVEISPPKGQDIASLNEARDAILSMAKNSNEALSLKEMVRRADRVNRHHIIGVDLASGNILRHAGPPMHPDELRDIERLSEQPSPLSLIRRNFETVGPVKLNVGSKEIALFMMRPNGPPTGEISVIYFLCIALVITIVLSYLFARSLVKPIKQLQQSSKALAAGNWKARVEKPALRRDELGELSRDFNAMASQLEKMWQGQQRLLADISHELRSPLARLQMALGIAHQQDVDPATLSRIEREAERMEALVAQLLTLTRAESAVPQFDSLSLEEVFQSTLADATFEAGNHGKKVEVSPFPSAKVVVNHTMICSAVENVIRNAIRYAESCVSVCFTVTDTHWEVVVSDDGPGLDEADCKSIFSPFYRASLARDRESGGVGLGLAIAKAAVEMHHGEIHATRNTSSGLAVSIAVPMDGQKQWNGNSPQNTN